MIANLLCESLEIDGGLAQARRRSSLEACEVEARFLQGARERVGSGFVDAAEGGRLQADVSLSAEKSASRYDDGFARNHLALIC